MVLELDLNNESIYGINNTDPFQFKIKKYKDKIYLITFNNISISKYKPTFEHDCNDCIFIDKILAKNNKDIIDMYYCIREDQLIARYGEEGYYFTEVFLDNVLSENDIKKYKDYKEFLKDLK